MQLKLGIMQGRLLPKIDERYQCFPAFNWQKEFYLAKKLGLKTIEFIFDNFYPHLNPLISKDGLKELKKIQILTNIKVESICADYFMENPIFVDNPDQSKLNLLTLEKVVKNAKFLNIKNIILPCVDQSSLNSKKKIDLFVTQMNKIKHLLDETKINISLETDLPPKKFLILINRFKSKYITINYDTGNSAALGYDPEEEFKAYGSKISEVHIKDRRYKGGPIFLGKGDVDFKKIFKLLKQHDYKGDFILQMYRDQKGLNIFKKQYKILKKLINEK